MSNRGDGQSIDDEAILSLLVAGVVVELIQRYRGGVLRQKAGEMVPRAVLLFSDPIEVVLGALFLVPLAPTRIRQ